MSVKLLTENHLEFLSLKGGYTGSSESTLVKMPHCWKSHVTAHMCLVVSERTYPVSVILIVGISGSRFATFSTIVCQMLSATLLFFYKMSGGLLLFALLPVPRC